MSDLVGNPEDRFSHNEAPLRQDLAHNETTWRIAYVVHKGTDQPVRSYSIISTSAVHSKLYQVFKPLASSRNRSDHSECNVVCGGFQLRRQVSS